MAPPSARWRPDGWRRLARAICACSARSPISPPIPFSAPPCTSRPPRAPNNRPAATTLPPPRPARDQPGFGPGGPGSRATGPTPAAVAIENARLFAETQRRLQRLQALRTIDLAITSSMDSHISLRVLVDQAMTHLAVDAVDVLLLDPQTHRLELASSRGFKTAPPRFALRVDEGLAGQAFMERRMLHVPSLGSMVTHTVRDPWFTTEGFDTYFGMPLVAKG